MKTEHIIAFSGSWYHFFIKPSQGFCVSKKNGPRFEFCECLLNDAFDDFSVAATEECLYAVCQDNQGAIVYFIFDGNSWRHERILETRDKKAEFKNLTLKAIGKFVNLFYVIRSKEDSILVHQLLGNPVGQPKVADYISGYEFSVCGHQTSDLTILYRNRDDIYGTRRFRWSKKDFEGFLPLECGCNLEHAVIIADANDDLCIAGYAAFDKFVNILFLKKEETSDTYVISAVHLVSGESEGLALSAYGGKLSISWCENGLVMTSACSEKNKWSAPKKYIRGTTQENVLFYIDTEIESFATYGCRQDGRIMLYITRDILEHPPKEKPVPRKTPTAGKTDKNIGVSREYVPRGVYSADMAAVRKLLASQNDIIVEMLKKITALERLAFQENKIAETPDQIDRLAAENMRNENNTQ